MVKFKTYTCHDDQFGRDAFKMLIPHDWNARGGIVWREHPAMPAAVDLTLRSCDNLYALGLLPSAPYTWNGMNMFSLFGQGFGGSYLGNQLRKPAGNAYEFICSDIMTKLGAAYHVTNVRPFPEMEQQLRQENPPSYGANVSFSASVVDFEYQAGGMSFEGSATCGIVYVSAMTGQTIWVADKMFVTSFPKGQREKTAPIFATMIKSFKIDLQWYNMLNQYVQASTNTVMNGIYQAGVRSRIISNMSNQISDMTRHSYERQQAAYDRVYRGISESIRGVNSYHDPYKGYDVEFPVDYRYVYANPLGEYYVTNNPNDNPNYGSNLNWTILNG
jgi:hypothetical protein